MSFVSKAKNEDAKRRKIENGPVIAQVSDIGIKEADHGTGQSTTIYTSSKCQFFVERKKRNCKADAILDKPYCAEHSYLNQSKDDDLLTKNVAERKRIPCPMDPKHTCYEDQLEKHLRKCNARKELRPVYFEENINLCDESTESEVTVEKFAIRDVPREELFEVIHKCKSLYEKYKEEFSKTEILFHSVMQDSANDPKNGAAAQKHITQQSSLIAQMDKLQLLKENYCYIEFGAGKGGLSHYVQKAEPSQNAQFVLVDRSSVRYKMDSYHKGKDQGPSFERLKIDIKHLNLDKVTTLDNDRPIVSIGKHLCGNATDLMLRCLIKTLHEKEDCKRYIKGITLAMCCHHRCDWNSYTGKTFLKENDISPHQFNIMCSITSWAVCGNKQIEDKNYSHHFYGELRPQDREEIGFQVKRIIEFGRVNYLKDNGFTHAGLVHFVRKECTPENVCIIATKENLSDRFSSDKDEYENLSSTHTANKLSSENLENISL